MGVSDGESDRAAEHVHGLVDHLFRRESGRMVAGLTRAFGPRHLTLAEEVVQEALLQALRLWPFQGVPDQPVAWLYRVARNRALDHLRRDSRFREKEEAVRHALETPSSREEHAGFRGEITDDQLRLVFLCCHPSLARDSRVALTLKTAAGFSAREIARAFLVKEATVAQRLVRAQRSIRERRLPFGLPPPDELAERLDAVLEVVYLVFNEGYSAHAGGDLVRTDLCREALTLAGDLSRLPVGDRPDVHALVALLCFQASRLPARVDSEGNLVRLEDQDRALWDPALVSRGFAHLERAASGASVSAFHLEAVIASHHAAAKGDAATDWAAILEIYDQLLDLNPSPIVALNRAVALARVRGAEAGLAALEEVAAHKALAGYYLLHATRADLLARKGAREEARRGYEEALECPCSEPERRFLEERLSES